MKDWNIKDPIKPTPEPYINLHELKEFTLLDLSEEDFVQKLHIYKRNLNPKELNVEIDILKRLKYKNKNQQKSSLHFKKFILVHKLLKNLKMVCIEELIGEILKGLVREKKSNSQTFVPKLPSKQFLYFILTRSTGMFVLLEKICKNSRVAYIEFRNLAKQTYFMPISITAMASLSKISLISKNIITHLEDFFNFIKKIFRVYPVIPTEESSATNLPVSLSAFLDSIKQKKATNKKQKKHSQNDNSEDNMNLEMEENFNAVNQSEVSELCDAFWGNLSSKKIENVSFEEIGASIKPENIKSELFEKKSDLVTEKEIIRPVQEKEVIANKNITIKETVSKSNKKKKKLHKQIINKDKSKKADQQKKDEIDEIFGFL
ncbi:hypothetical protein HK099_005955 [Clydaea vesicula]|uniref:Nucleolus and neural progenitor protein-like N-terminal domain-containing protein n=1 Tax=Clydaea vesicula TaxID=447962 RepID=A0AAD5Y2N6_9FUNG|nr:hypothetical protein HK099_005955 [Clydaea vesicula]